MPTDKPRITITIEDSLLARVEKYQRDFRFSTKSRAIRALLDSGLSERAEPVTSMPPSQDITPDGLSHMANYCRLDARDQGFIDGVISQLLRADKYTQE